GYNQQHSFEDSQGSINDEDVFWSNINHTSPCNISPLSSHSSQAFPSPVSSWSDDLTDIMEVLEEMEGASSPFGSIPRTRADSHSVPSNSEQPDQPRDTVPVPRRASANLPKPPRKYKPKPAQVRSTQEYEIKRAKNYDAVRKNRAAAADRYPKQLQRLDYMQKGAEFILRHYGIRFPSAAELGLEEDYDSFEFVPTACEKKKLVLHK
ncbi:hypothetical protein PMAYCL1PPCAC_10237, partial [Pristionchus mayeri]